MKKKVEIKTIENCSEKIKTIIKTAVKKIEKKKGKDYAPTSKEIQNAIN